MRKLKLIVCMSLMLGMLFVVTGCSKKSEPKEVFTKTSEAMNDIKNLTGDIAMNMDINMSAGDENSIAMKAKVDGDIKLTTEKNLSMAMNLNTNVDILGQKQESKTSMYIVEEDGALVQYSGDGETWVKTTTTLDDSMWNLAANNSDIYKTLAKNEKYIEYIGSEKIKGKDALEYAVTIDQKLLNKLLSKENKEILDEQLKQLEDVITLDDLKLKLSIFIYEDDYTVAKIYMDLDKAFDDIINQAMKSAGTELGEMKLSVKKLDMSITFDKYNKTKAIEVPYDVKNNAEIY